MSPNLDEERFQRIQKRLFSDEIGRLALKLFSENSDNPKSFRTCPDCKKICHTTSHLNRHIGSEECLEKQCINSGKKYIPIKPFCDVCKISYSNQWSLNRHLQSKCHKNKIGVLKKFYCKICSMKFKNKKCLTQHTINSKKHLKNQHKLTIKNI